jgi:hypothetical protein
MTAVKVSCGVVRPSAALAPLLRREGIPAAVTNNGHTEVPRRTATAWLAVRNMDLAIRQGHAHSGSTRSRRPGSCPAFSMHPRQPPGSFRSQPDPQHAQNFMPLIFSPARRGSRERRPRRHALHRCSHQEQCLPRRDEEGQSCGRPSLGNAFRRPRTSRRPALDYAQHEGTAGNYLSVVSRAMDPFHEGPARDRRVAILQPRRCVRRAASVRSSTTPDERFCWLPGHPAGPGHLAGPLRRAGPARGGCSASC